MAGESTERQIVKTYLDAAHEALAGGQFNLDGGYYAIRFWQKIKRAANHRKLFQI